ncbi:hypothetical protein Rsub_13263 [Raphidocelis subcapitata]|uniref:Uncharacterized protein n=1 Tax=Raphidocelis subcapitata TaxID=307507 RepID=A0A2V0PQZ1_9CHLO|nr:hypothetical protein Rsub_13263 [Raphidocelis subcapitata]|eukprot:GBG00501.1 hypothetical protein Rsub_13263 [Raphidocelis subcapitata]
MAPPPPPPRMLPPLDPDVLPQPFRAIDRTLNQIIDGAARIADLRAQQRDLAARARACRIQAPTALCAAPRPCSAFCPSPAGGVCVASAPAAAAPPAQVSAASSAGATAATPAAAAAAGAAGFSGRCELLVMQTRHCTTSAGSLPSGGGDGPSAAAATAAAAAAAPQEAAGSAPAGRAQAIIRSQPITALDVVVPDSGPAPAAPPATSPGDGARAIAVAGMADGSLCVLAVAGDGRSQQVLCDCAPARADVPCVCVEFSPGGRWLASLAAYGAADVYAWQPRQPPALAVVLRVEPPAEFTGSSRRDPGVPASLVWRPRGLIVWWRGSNVLRRYGFPAAAGQPQPLAVAGASQGGAPPQQALPTEWTLPHAIACAAVVPRGEGGCCGAAGDGGLLALGLANGSVLLFDELQSGFSAALPRLPSPATHLLALPQQHRGAGGPPRVLAATESGTLLTAEVASPVASSGRSGEPAGAATGWRLLPLPQLFDVQALLPLPAPPAAGGQTPRAPLALVVATAARPAVVIAGLPPWADLSTGPPTTSSAATPPGAEPPPPSLPPLLPPRLLVIDTASGALLLELVPHPGLQLDCHGCGWPGGDGGGRSPRRCVPLAVRGSVLVAGAVAAEGDASRGEGPVHLLAFDLVAAAARAEAAVAEGAAEEETPAGPPLLPAAGGIGHAAAGDAAPLSGASLALVRDAATRAALRHAMACVGGAAPAGGGGGGGSGIRAARARGVREALSALAQRALASEVGGAQPRPLLLGAAGM